MKKVFWDNPYQTTLTTKVISVINNIILLEETIAFSFSGGQESGSGTINGFKILDSKIENKLIYYTIDRNHNLNPSDTVIMNIDWERRYKLMRLHFAAELILELVTKKLQIEKIGAHIAADKARIDFIYDKNISIVFAEILAEYNEIIARDAVIKTGFTDIDAQRRYWEIDGLSKVACGGTHVRSTAEVGYITLKRVNVGKSKERIELRLMSNN
ncbi:MAG: alanyl-tRNA editing protein [Burkholderiales bacterium]|nr:alanyl-tRNA editing protein [Burkholderiales bacterium]